MKIVARVLERRIREVVNVDEMQLSFMAGRGTTDEFFILRKMQEEYRDKGSMLYMCFVDVEKAFHRVARKVMEWVMKRKVYQK